jgi:hypothetical protein
MVIILKEIYVHHGDNTLGEIYVHFSHQRLEY